LSDPELPYSHTERMSYGHVFLSHNHGDKAFVRRLANDLRDRGVKVWLDEWEMRVGDSLVERIEAGIREAGYLVVVLSANSVNSPWVIRELNAALAEELGHRGMFILPVLIEDCDVPLFVRDKMYADFRYRYSDGFHALLKSVMPGDMTPPKLVFDSARDDPTFETWAVHCSAGAKNAEIHFQQADDGSNQLVLTTSPKMSIGVNKSIGSLHGRACFDYRIVSVGKPGSHIYFAMIPIQETGYHRSGVIEVGTNVAADPRNPRSPYRIRYHVPSSHQLDRTWHTGTVDFDFRDTPTSFYAIFAFRINEGIDVPDYAQVELGRVQLYSW
jgi:hypothetical protein